MALSSIRGPRSFAGAGDCSPMRESVFGAFSVTISSGGLGCQTGGKKC